MKLIGGKITVNFIFFIGLLGLSYFSASAQKSENSAGALPPRELIKTVSAEAKSVVKIKVVKIGEQKYSDNYSVLTAEGTILKSYKGNLKAGQKLKYTVFAENKADLKLGARIAFLVLKKDVDANGSAIGAKKHWGTVETGEFVFSPKLERIVKSVLRRR
ncbi:MAG: hypothetical protein M3033_08505 [Acidobacteriota bacterium]|nr:hypothetical protein [Acidobacteriota bacterium]